MLLLAAVKRIVLKLLQFCALLYFQQLLQRLAVLLLQLAHLFAMRLAQALYFMLLLVG